jgi:hypothetical protein
LTDDRQSVNQAILAIPKFTRQRWLCANRL